MRRVLAMVSLLFTFLFVMPSWAEDAPAAAAAVTQAAPAADAPAADAAAAPAPEAVDPLAQLERLASLHEKGLLSAEEFSAAKAKLLGL